MSQFIKITEDYSVAHQLGSAAMDAAAKAGFHAVICNRPDNEESNQPTLDEMAKTAARAGLAFHAIPFDMNSFDRAVVDALETAIGTAKGPVLAYCRTGTRSTMAWCALQRRAGREMADILEDARAAGYELDGAAGLIESLA